MCAIHGFLHADGRPAGPWRETLDAMARRQQHRGPDGEGCYLDPHVGLGHRRLAIIDPRGGHQPMSAAEGALQLVCNGEIYNEPQLRRELESRGHRFRSRCDNEVVLHAYAEWGLDFVDRLDGMFAFALWDAPRRRLVLGRDRFGKKPLYHVGNPRRGFAFASEIKGLWGFPGVDREVDVEALCDYVSLGYVPRDKSIYRKIRRLLPGHLLVAEDGTVRSWAYAALSFAPRHRDPADVEALRTVLANAVAKRLRSDVPVGAFLSGGLDSSTVVHAMASQVAGNVATDVVGFSSDAFDERPFARAVADQFATDHRATVVDEDVDELVVDLAHAFDEPFADSSAMPTYCLARVARERYTVALSGDGGDEIFAGYQRYGFAAREDRARDVLSRRWAAPLAAALAARPVRAIATRLELPGREFLQRVSEPAWKSYLHAVSAVDDEEKNRLLAPDVQDALGGYRTDTLFDDLYAAAEGDTVTRLQAIDFATYLPDDILTKVDRTSMAHGLEVRCPLLDRDLVALVASLPSYRRRSSWRGKIILREAMRDMLPPCALERRKQGFSLPLAAWLRERWAGLVVRHVLENRQLDLFVSRSEARRIWAQHQRGERDRSRALWTMVMLGVWARHASED